MKLSNFTTYIDKALSARVLMWVIPLALIVPNVILDITDYSNWPVKTVNVLLPAGIYLWLMSLSRNVGRTALLMFPLIFYAAFQVVLLYLYGESIIAVDMFLNLVTTNVSEATELLGNLSLAIITVIVLYLLPMLWAVWLLIVRRHATPDVTRRGRRIGLAVTGSGLVALVAAYVFVPHYSMMREVFPVNVIHNTFIAASRTIASYHYLETSAAYDDHAHATHDPDAPEVYVLVIGETSRADNWQLGGYDRPTNPRLSRRPGIVFFNKAISQSNTTHKSVPLLLSSVTVDTFNDSIYYTKSIVSTFNQAGFRTAYLTNQARNHSFIDFFAREAQVNTFLRDDGRQHYDDELLPLLQSFIESSPSNKVFVVLHTYGSHFNYNDRYPAGQAVFTPVSDAAASAANREQLVNAYDNTIVYTDAFLDRVISTIDNLDCPAAMLYLSDHGEDIFDDRRGRFLHASPVPTYWQLHVPLLLWMSAEYTAAYPDALVQARAHSGRDIASNEIVFDTMLQLAGLVTDRSRHDRSIIDSSFTRSMRRYLNDHNEDVPLDAVGLRSYDYDMFHKRGISYR